MSNATQSCRNLLRAGAVGSISQILLFRDDEAVATSLPLINNAGLSRLRIGEGIECVADEVHLKNCFLGCHGLEGKALYTDLKLVLFHIFVIIILTDKYRRLLYHTLNTCLVLSDLPFKALASSVKSSDKGLVLFFAAEGGTAVIYGDFDDFYSFANLAGDECFGIGAKELIKLGKLLFNRILTPRRILLLMGERANPA